MTAVDVAALEQAHALGDALPWRLDPDVELEVQDVDGLEVATPHLGDDAALIVAAVNALPQLIAAVRAVWAFADGWDDVANIWGETARKSADPDAIDQAVAESAWYRERANSLRTVIDTALDVDGATT